MELIVKNFKSGDGKIVKGLYIDAELVAFSREAGFSTIMPLDRDSEDAARQILQKALDSGYEGPVSKLMKKE